MNKNFILFGITAILLISLVASLDIEYSFKQNTKVDLKRTCYYNGTYCTISTLCNITITDKNNNNIITNAMMGNLTANYPNWNITLSNNNNLELGIYKADMSCCISGECGSDTFYYEITPSGEVSPSNNRNIIGLFILLFIVGYGILVFGVVIKNEIVTIIGGMGMMILGLYTLNNGIDIYRNFATQFFSIVTCALGGYWSFVAGMSLIEGG